jgi:steroid 5-alpha reductase family enzyme
MTTSHIVTRKIKENHSFLAHSFLVRNAKHAAPRRVPMRLRSSAAAAAVATAASATAATAALKVLPPVFSWAPCARAAAVFAAANGAGYAVSIASGGSHLHLDLIGSGAFVAAAAATRGQHARTRLSAMLVGVWGARLASFLFYRVVSSESQHDARLDSTSVRDFWAVSFLWGAICALPHTIGAGAARPAALGVLGVGAAALAVGGIAVESLADWQKHRFKADPANAGKFCSVGLYSFVQQPNYLGDLMLWSGVLLLNVPSTLVGLAGGSGGAKLAALGRLGLATLSPVFMLALFYGQMHGTITNSAELRYARYGADPEFREYAQTTPFILPFIAPPPLKDVGGARDLP